VYFLVNIHKHTYVNLQTHTRTHLRTLSLSQADSVALSTPTHWSAQFIIPTENHASSAAIALPLLDGGWDCLKGKGATRLRGHVYVCLSVCLSVWLMCHMFMFLL